MRTTLLSVLALAVAANFASAQGPANRAAIEKQIAEMDFAINEAVAKGDVATFRKMVPDDTVVIDTGGAGKAADFAKMLGSFKLEPGWKIDSPQWQWVNDTTVVYIYRWTGKGTMMGQPIPSPTHSSTVWTNRGGRWVPTFHQETPAMPVK